MKKSINTTERSNNEPNNFNDWTVGRKLRFINDGEVVEITYRVDETESEKTENMGTTVKHNVRTNCHSEGTPDYIAKTTYPTKTISDRFSTAEEFLAAYPPTIPSARIIAKIKDQFAIRGSVTYNYGKGNVTFYFS